MATWVPINGLAIQLAKNAAGAAAADYYLKFYDEGTTTPVSMATDSTGGTTLDKCKLDANGLAVNGSDDPFIPHIDRNYKLVCYTNATDADNNATGSAFFVIDNIKLGGAINSLYTPEGTNASTVSIATYLDKRVLDDVTALRAYEPVYDEEEVFISGYTVRGKGGGKLWHDASDTTTADNGVTVFVTTGGARWKRPRFELIEGAQAGIVADGTTNDAVAFRRLWDALRDDWYDNGLDHEVKLSGDIVIDNPAEDLAGTAAFIMDFPCVMRSNLSNVISVNNLSSTTMYAFQIGTYASRDEGVKKVTDFRVNCNNACSGITFADLFQGAGVAYDIKVENADAAGQVGIRCVNVQELWVQRWTMLECDTCLFLEGGASVNRAEGTDGSYSLGSGAANNNNNQFNGMTVQQPDDYGIRITQAENCSFSGVIQGTWSQWAFYCEGGDDIRLYDIWFETPSATHNEVQFTASYNGRILVENTHLTSPGAEFIVNGARSLTLLGGNNLGSLEVNDDTIPVIMDFDETGGGSNLGAYVELSEFRRIQSNTEEAFRFNTPTKKNIYSKQTIPASTTETIHAYGNDSTGDETKGGWGIIHMYNASGTQCVTEFFFTAQGSFPACATSIVDKIGTQAGASANLTITRAGSSPFHLLEIKLQNTDASNTLSYECWLYTSQF